MEPTPSASILDQIRLYNIFIFASNLESREFMLKLTSPGKILQVEFLDVYGMSAQDLADETKIDVKTINNILRDHTIITPSISRKLGKVFNMSPNFFFNLTRGYLLSNIKLHYKNYVGDVKYDNVDKIFYGHVLNTKPNYIVSYEGKNLNELMQDFKDAVESM